MNVETTRNHTAALALKTLGLTVAATTVLLSGCGGNTPSTGSPAPASQAPASTSSSAAPSSAEPSSAAPSSAEPSTASGSVQDPCDVISVDEMEKLAGVKLSSSKSSKTGPLTLCTYTPPSASSVPVLAAEGSIAGSTLDKEIVALQKTAGGDTTVTDVEVNGADEAKAVTAKISGFNQVYVVATKGDIFYGGIVSGKESRDTYEKAGVKIVETLLQG